MRLFLLFSFLATGTTIYSQCPTVPSGAVDCVERPSAIIKAVGDPSMETDVSYWISQGCLLDFATAGTTAQNIVVIGDLRFDVNYRFSTGSEITVMPYVEFAQTAGITVSIDGTLIHACDTMWQHWRLEGNSSPAGATLKIRDSEIRDAINGFILQPNSTIGALRDTFINNRISIRTDIWACDDYISATGFGMEDYIITPGICDNIFTSNSLLPPYSGQLALSGVQIQEANLFDIGTGTGCSTLNQFSNMDYGIRACGVASMDVQNSVFTDIGSEVSLGNETGIHFSDPFNGASLLTQAGIGTTSASTFSHSTSAITVLNADAVLEDNLISDVFDGIFWSIGIARVGEIKDNVIDEYEGFGISSQYNAPHDITISENTIINGNNSINTGIFDAGLFITNSALVTNNTNPLTVKSNVFQNVKTASNETYYGLMANYSSGGLIDSNSIQDLSSGNSYTGNLRLSNCHNQTVRRNSVTSTNPQFGSIPSFYGGFVFSETPNLKILCNIANGTINGLQFYENCDYANIKENDIQGGHDDGLYYSSTTTITGTQDNKGNTWPGATSTVEANWPGVGPLYLSYSEYFVSTSPPSVYWPNPVSPSTSWFIQTGSDKPLLCGEQSGGGGDNFQYDPEELSMLDKAILEEEFESPFGQEARLYDYKSKLFRLLYNFAELKNSHPEAPNFYDHQATQNLGKLVSIEERLSQVLDITPTDHATLKSLRSTLNEGQQEQRLLQLEWDQQGGDSLFSSDLYLQILEKANANSIIISAIATLRAEIIDVQKANAEILLGELEALNPQSSWEENLIFTLTQLLTNKIGDGHLQWSPEIKAELVAIAEKCPYTDGRGVFHARSLLADKLWTVIKDDPACGAVNNNQSRQSVVNKLVSTDWQIYPSPAMDIMHIQRSAIGPVSYELINNMGTLVQSGKAQYNSPIDISALRAGLYYVKIKDVDDAEHFVQPLQIIR